MPKQRWDDACAASYLLKVAADLVRDDTPFHDEIKALCKAAYKSLRTRTHNKLDYVAPTVMPRDSFRRRLSGILEWDTREINKACREVLADAKAKNRSLPQTKPT